MKLFKYAVEVVLHPKKFFDRIRKESISETLFFIFFSLLLVHSILFVLESGYAAFIGTASIWGRIFQMEAVLFVYGFFKIFIVSFFLHLGFKLVGSRKKYSELLRC
jgi:hypothetical protein